MITLEQSQNQSGKMLFRKQRSVLPWFYINARRYQTRKKQIEGDQRR